MLLITTLHGSPKSMNALKTCRNANTICWGRQGLTKSNNIQSLKKSKHSSPKCHKATADKHLVGKQKKLEDMWCNESTSNHQHNLLEQVLVFIFQLLNNDAFESIIVYSIYSHSIFPLLLYPPSTNCYMNKFFLFCWFVPYTTC